MKVKKDPRGRKPVVDKIIPIRIYVKTSTVDLIGGKEKVQDLLNNAVIRKAARIIYSR